MSTTMTTAMTTATTTATATETSGGGGSVAPRPPTQSMYCMELKTLQAQAFKTLFEVIKDILTDTTLQFDAAGLKIVDVSTSETMIVHLLLEADRFEHYECERPMKVGINLLSFNKLIKTITSNDTLSLFVEKSDTNHLGIRIENSLKNTKTTYRLTMLDLDHPIVVPKMDFSRTITMPSADFQKICRNLNTVADYVEIKDVQNQLIFSFTHESVSQETIIYDDRKLQQLQQQQEEEPKDAKNVNAKDASQEIVHGVFSVKHLNTFAKCTHLCNTVDLLMENDLPLLVRYGVAYLGEIKLMLVPHMDPDMDQQRGV